MVVGLKVFTELLDLMPKEENVFSGGLQVSIFWPHSYDLEMNLHKFLKTFVNIRHHYPVLIVIAEDGQSFAPR